MDLEHTDEIETHGAFVAPAEIAEELEPTQRQKLGEAVFGLLRWLSDEKPGCTVEARSRTVHLKVLAAVHVLAPTLSNYDTLAAIGRLMGGIGRERVRQIAEDAKRHVQNLT